MPVIHPAAMCLYPVCSFRSDSVRILLTRRIGVSSLNTATMRSKPSRTAPFAVEELENRGARIGTQPTVEQLAERERQARIFELENRQKLWRWLIVAVLGLLIAETALAGRLAHRTLQPQVST